SRYPAGDRRRECHASRDGSTRTALPPDGSTRIGPVSDGDAGAGMSTAAGRSGTTGGTVRSSACRSTRSDARVTSGSALATAAPATLNPTPSTRPASSVATPIPATAPRTGGYSPNSRLSPPHRRINAKNRRAAHPTTSSVSGLVASATPLSAPVRRTPLPLVPSPACATNPPRAPRPPYLQRQAPRAEQVAGHEHA